MHYILYQITNKLNSKIYVGVHKTKDLDDGYMGSGKIIRSAIQKHGIENFEKKILQEFDRPEDMFAAEAALVTEEFLSREDVYNLRRGGTGGFDYINNSNIPKFKGHRHGAKTKMILSDLGKEREVSMETKTKLSENHWSIKDRAAHSAHASKIAKERQTEGKSEEERKKISSSMTEAWKSGKYANRKPNTAPKNLGKMWINNGIIGKMIMKDQPIPEGWYRGNIKQS